MLCGCLSPSSPGPPAPSQCPPTPTKGLRGAPSSPSPPPTSLAPGPATGEPSVLLVFLSQPPPAVPLGLFQPLLGPQNVLWVKIWVAAPAPSDPFPSERGSHPLSPADSTMVWASSGGFPTTRPTWGLQAHLLWGGLAPCWMRGWGQTEVQAQAEGAGWDPTRTHCHAGDHSPAPCPFAWPDVGPPPLAAARGAGPAWGWPPS